MVTWSQLLQVDGTWEWVMVASAIGFIVLAVAILWKMRQMDTAGVYKSE